MGLQPVPVADDGGSFHRVATLRPLPSEGPKTNSDSTRSLYINY